MFFKLLLAFFFMKPFVLCNSNWFIDQIYTNYSNSHESMSFPNFEQILNKLDFINVNKSDNYSCYSSYDLMNYFNLTNEIKKPDFYKLSTALIWQLITPECKSYHVHENQAEEKCENSKTYLYGILAIVITWAVSAINVFILSRVQKRHEMTRPNDNMFLISALNALAIGILLGDTFLHIVPSTLGLSDHDVHGHEQDHDHVPHSRSVSDNPQLAAALWKMSGSLATVFALYLFEAFLGHDHDDGHGHGHGHSHGHTHDKIHPEDPLDKVEQMMEQEPPKSSKLKDDLKKIQPNGWIAFVGDMIHKLADGFAIGAAFSESLSLGFSTSLAILFHEIPHELGDYSILKSAGFNNWTIFILNSITSFFCLIGFLVIAIAEPSKSFREWMFAITIGVFIYLALVIMLPRLKSIFQKNGNSKRNYKRIAIVITLFIFGWASMFLLAYFEEDIQIKLPGTNC